VSLCSGCFERRGDKMEGGMSAQPVAIFLDTNLFLHYRPISEIDWCRLVQARPVEIKIAAVVTRELEEQRVVHQSRKIRERAGSAVKLLQSYIRQSHVRDGVPLQFLVDEPTAAYAAAHNLNLLLADDRLIGTLLLYRDANPDARCIIVTNDLPLTVKLTHRQIEFISLDDSLLLQSEPDPLERKNKQLEAELLRYKSREPDLAIEFTDGRKYSRFRLTPVEAADPEPEIQAKLAVAREKCKSAELAPSPQPVNANDPFAAVAEQVRQVTEGFHVMGRQFYEHYNRRVEQYYRDYEKYLRDTADFEALAARTIKLELILHNSGTCPAEDIDVSLHFPDGFMLYDEEHPPEPPEEPSVPSMEMNLFPSVSFLPGFPDINRLTSLPDRTRPRIRKTNSYDVTFEVLKLKHGFIWTIEPFYVAFDSWASAASFAIDYTIHAGNMIDQQTGHLSIVVEKT
jgi:rRNA-processing protein FCF1